MGIRRRNMLPSYGRGNGIRIQSHDARTARGDELLRVTILRCTSESCRIFFAVEEKEDYTAAYCPFCLNDFYVNHFAEGVIHFDDEVQE